VPAVLALAGRFGTRGLRVVSVTKHGDGAEERAEVAEAAKHEKMTYPCFIDLDGKWSESAGIGHIPAFVVLDRKGRLVYRHGGKLTEGSADYEALTRAIEQALAAPQSG
jgi:predicted DsbA family dithiol-disulfide isomerase